jgi:hypothetical protein
MTPPLLPFDGRACLIAGQGKSGTTLLLSLLDGHRQLLPFPEETAYFPTVLTKFANAGREAQIHHIIEKSEARLLFSHDARGGGRDYSAFPAGRMRETFLEAARDPANASRDLLAILMAAYAETTGTDTRAITRWIEKTPANRNHLEAILERFPNAKIILTLRDPRGVFDARLQRERSKKIPRLSIFDNVRNWRTAARNALAYANHPAFHLVRFEHLLEQPEATMRDLARFLGIAWTPSLLEPTKAGTPWQGNSASKAAFHGINRAPVDRWRKGLEPVETAWIERHCADLMVRLGYEPVLEPSARPPWWKPVPGESPRSYLRSRLKSARMLSRNRP